MTPQIIGIIITVVGLVFSIGVFVGVTKLALNLFDKRFDKLDAKIDAFEKDHNVRLMETERAIAVIDVRVDKLENPHRPSNGANSP